METKGRKVLCKLYLTAQGFIALVGVGFLLFHIVAMVHDLRVSKKGMECFKEVTQLMKEETYNKALDLGNDWARFGEGILKAFDHPSKKYTFQEKAKYLCSEFFVVHISTDGDYISIWTKNYLGSSPAYFSERLGYLGLCVGIPAVFMGLLFGLMRWLKWLSA